MTRWHCPPLRRGNCGNRTVETRRWGRCCSGKAALQIDSIRRHGHSNVLGFQRVIEMKAVVNPDVLFRSLQLVLFSNGTLLKFEDILGNFFAV